MALGSSGLNDWKNIASRLKEHEKSKGHLETCLKWIELEARSKKQCTIDSSNHKQMNDEKMRWTEVFQRLLAIVQYLCEHNMAFRGSVDKLYQPKNGNFLGLIELFAKFDPILQEHTRRIRNNEIHDHYLGPRVQNELINLMGNKVRQTIVQRVKFSKYFCIILDCTPDQSHQEQMSLTIRYVSDGFPGIKPGIYEHFIKFVQVNDSSTGKNLFDLLLHELKMLNLDVSDIRGQGYDNGANLKGSECGLQARLQQINPRAFFTPCACHNYNLLISDMAKSCHQAVSFFGIIHRIYILVSASTQRWSIIRKHVSGLTLKPLSNTRWECHVESVKAIRYQMSEVYDALAEIAESVKDPVTQSEAESLCNELKSFNFIVSIIFWFDILFHVNLVSKMMQSDSMDLGCATDSLKKTYKWLQEYRNNGLNSAISGAKELAAMLEVEPVFKQKRIRRKPKLFDYESEDSLFTDPLQSYKVQYFNVIMDTAILSLQNRFQQMKEHILNFGFLYNFQNLSKDEVTKYCKDLELILTVGENRDLDGFMLAEEIQALKVLLPHNLHGFPLQIFEWITKLNRLPDFPNFSIALRILLTIPITVASGERTFSKLKLIKNYLRSSMLQERLNDLSILSIQTAFV